MYLYHDISTYHKPYSSELHTRSANYGVSLCRRNDFGVTLTDESWPMGLKEVSWQSKLMVEGSSTVYRYPLVN